MIRVVFQRFDQIWFWKLVSVFQFVWFWQVLIIYQHKQLSHSWMWWSSWYSTCWLVVVLDIWFCVRFQLRYELVTFQSVFNIPNINSLQDNHDLLPMFMSLSRFVYTINGYVLQRWFSTFWESFLSWALFRAWFRVLFEAVKRSKTPRWVFIISRCIIHVPLPKPR